MIWLFSYSIRYGVGSISLYEIQGLSWELDIIGVALM